MARQSSDRTYDRDRSRRASGSDTTASAVSYYRIDADDDQYLFYDSLSQNFRTALCHRPSEGRCGGEALWAFYTFHNLCHFCPGSCPV